MKRTWKHRLTAIVLTMVLILATLPCTASAVSYYYGDIDYDGRLTSTDARAMLCHVIGTSVLDDAAQADMVTDGVLNSSDIRQALYVIVEDLPLRPYDPAFLSASQYVGEPYRALNGNMPLFSETEKTSVTSFETYAPLDALGRCGVAYANLSTALMPDEERESISSVTPTGWHNQSYDFISGGWLYNRSHLIGFQLAGEQANALNLITGTRYFNTEGMLPFENMVADYIRETEHHVLYRVTPVFIGDNLLAEGVTIEAWSVEDNGEGICFYVFCYNVQPGVRLYYATGENTTADAPPVDDDPVVTVTFVLNTATKKFHLLTCRYATSMNEDNREDYGGTRDALIADGYTPCGTCKP